MLNMQLFMLFIVESYKNTVCFFLSKFGSYKYHFDECINTVQVSSYDLKYSTQCCQTSCCFDSYNVID